MAVITVDGAQATFSGRIAGTTTEAKTVSADDNSPFLFDAGSAVSKGHVILSIHDSNGDEVYSVQSKGSVLAALQLTANVGAPGEIQGPTGPHATAVYRIDPAVFPSGFIKMAFAGTIKDQVVRAFAIIGGTSFDSALERVTNGNGTYEVKIPFTVTV